MSNGVIVSLTRGELYMSTSITTTASTTALQATIHGASL